MADIKVVIFDLDGTLIDSMGVWTRVDREFLEKRGLEMPKNLFQELDQGNSFLEVAEFFKKRFDLPDTPQEIMDEWTGMVRHHYQHEIPLKPGAKYLLDSLKRRGIKLAVGTSNNEELTRCVLVANHVFEMFDLIVTGGREIKGKPFPDIYLSIAEQLGVQPEECLVIEDVLVGVQAALNAGMTVFAIADDFAKLESDEIRSIADYYAEEYVDLNRHIEALLNPPAQEDREEESEEASAGK